MRLKKINMNFGAQMFKALSDESRIRILNLVYQNKRMCITDLENVLDFTQTKTSRHLIFLKNAGILTVKKIDQWAFYSIRNEVLDIIEQLLQMMNIDNQLKTDIKNYNTMLSNRELAVSNPKIQRFINKII